MGGYEEFVVVDGITVTKERFVLIVEAKRSSLGDEAVFTLDQGYVG